jgi:hypothetical protein
MCHEGENHQCKYATCENGKKNDEKSKCCFQCSNIPTCEMACDDAKEWRKYRQ